MLEPQQKLTNRDNSKQKVVIINAGEQEIKALRQEIKTLKKDMEVLRQIVKKSVLEKHFEKRNDI